MKFFDYQNHVTNACTKGIHLDPLLILAYYRTAMRSPAATKVGSNPYKSAYRDMRDVLRRRSYLPDRKPRDWLDAGIMVVAKAQQL